MSNADSLNAAHAENTESEELERFLDVPVTMKVELGRRAMRVRDILGLKKGSIVELPRSAGESIDIYIGDRLIGMGEVLELEGKAGIRLTDIASEG